MPSTPESTVTDYVRAFESLDPDAVVGFYALPCTFVSPRGIVAVTSASEARAFVERLIEQARSQDYRRTEIPGGMEVRRLAENLARITGTFARFDSSGKEILRFGFTYLMRDDGAGWKIVVAAAHDAA